VFNRSACEHLEHLEHHIALKTMERNKQNEVYMRIREAVEYIGVAMRAMRGYIAEGEYCVNEGYTPKIEMTIGVMTLHRDFLIF